MESGADGLVPCARISRNCVVGTAVTECLNQFYLLTISMADKAPAAMVLGIYLVTGAALGLVPACAVRIS